ncbi:MAG: acetylornithine deacetylase [Planctomycetota bacterium]|nr:MAG: acetylornithine deacetylase [Planctomycetota bacterium]
MDAIQHLNDLIRFDSVSSKSNVSITDHVERLLKQHGFEVERLEYDDKLGVRKASIVGKLGSGTGGFAYFGHTDVVPASPWFTDKHGPFEPTIKEGKLYGRGSCDMKGSVACALAAAERIRAADLKHPIYITCTADEEVGYGGAKSVAERSVLYREMVAGDAKGIIGEPTCLEVVYSHKGTFGFAATSIGKASHSSTKEGLNANLAMIPFLVEMKAIHDEVEADPAWRHPEFDPPTICWNIGINDHTHACNITAPQSICTVYFRPMPGQNPQLLLDRARQAAERCGLQFEFRSGAMPLYMDPKSDFIQELLQLADRPKTQTVAYGTDGAMLPELKKKAVLGPGSIKQAHTWDEWIELDQLERGTALYEKLIRRWCCE